ASGSWDCSVRLWSLDLSLVSKHDQTNPSCHVLQGHKSNVKAVSFSCQGLLASASWDLSIILWDINTKSMNIILRGHTGWIQACTFSPDGNTLVSAADDQTVRVWDVNEGNCIKELECNTEEIHTCCFKPNGTLLASGPSTPSKNIQIYHENVLHLPS
ncbi:WD repeat-containing 38-like, partial [Paramuricea clavata]